MGVRKKRIMIERMKNNTEFVSLPGKILFSFYLRSYRRPQKQEEKRKKEKRRKSESGCVSEGLVLIS